jgi:hypothetical protein
LLYDVSEIGKARFGLLSVVEAKSTARARPKCALVIEAKNTSAEDLSGAERFGDYFLWIRHE